MGDCRCNRILTYVHAHPHIYSVEPVRLFTGALNNWAKWSTHTGSFTHPRTSKIGTRFSQASKVRREAYPGVCCRSRAPWATLVSATRHLLDVVARLLYLVSAQLRPTECTCAYTLVACRGMYTARLRSAHPSCPPVSSRVMPSVGMSDTHHFGAFIRLRLRC